MNNLANLNKRIETINNEIKNFDTDERKEIKKNNKLIDTYVLELNEISEILLNEIKNRYEELIPKNVENIENNEEIDVVLEKIRFLSDNSYIFKMGIDKNLYEIKNGNSLDKINENISDLINKFCDVKVELSKDDFKYSMSLYKYMSDFFDNKDGLEFDEKIKDTFDSLYWECPEIVNHIYLCFMLLLDKYKDKFELYIRNKYNDNKEYEKELENYYELVALNKDKLNQDEYKIYLKFSSGELRLEEYLDDSINKKDTISKFMDYDKYNSLNDEERMHFYEQIKGIYYDLCEYLWINKYSFVIDKVKEVYNDRNSHVDEYNSFIKNMKSLNKQREGLMKKLLFIYNRINRKNNDRLLKKYNNLFNKINVKIDEIINIYNNYNEILFVNSVIKKLNEDSTYYDVFKIVEDNYSFMLNFMIDKDGSYDECISYLYNPYLNISKSIPFLRDINIEDKLIEKYDLFDMEVNLSDKNKLKNDLEYIIRLGIYEKYNIKIDKFKLIFDIRKVLEG